MVLHKWRPAETLRVGPSLGSVRSIGNCKASIYKRVENSSKGWINQLATFTVMTIIGYSERPVYPAG